MNKLKAFIISFNITGKKMFVRNVKLFFTLSVKLFKLLNDSWKCQMIGFEERWRGGKILINDALWNTL